MFIRGKSNKHKHIVSSIKQEVAPQEQPLEPSIAEVALQKVEEVMQMAQPIEEAQEEQFECEECAVEPIEPIGETEPAQDFNELVSSLLDEEDITE